MPGLFRHIPIAGLILFLCCTSCAKDLSCYRDLIIGTWIEQSIDGNIPSSESRDILIVKQEFNRTFLLYDEDGNRDFSSVSADYDISCRDLTLFQQGVITGQYEIPRLNDSMLYLHPRSVNTNYETVMVGEFIYKKVREDDPNAGYIKQLWQAEADENHPAFRIQFHTNGSYQIYFEKNTEPEPEDPEGPLTPQAPLMSWEEKADEDGKYTVYGPLLQLSFFNNNLWGTAERKGATQWDLRFSVTKEDNKTLVTEMYWETYVYDNDNPSLYSLRLLPVPNEDEN